MDGPRDKDWDGDAADGFEPPYDPEDIPIPSRSPGNWPVRPEDCCEVPDDYRDAYGDDADRGR